MVILPRAAILTSALLLASLAVLSNHGWSQSADDESSRSTEDALDRILFNTEDGDAEADDVSSAAEVSDGQSEQQESDEAPSDEAESDDAQPDEPITQESKPQDDGSSSSATKEGRTSEFTANFWRYLQRAQYRNWAPVAGTTGDYQRGNSPHGSWVRVYLNRSAIGARKELPPYGSILVKENYDGDRQLSAITVMYRSRNCAPECNDWFWIKYRPDGEVEEASTADGSQPLAGRVQSCIDCHQHADGDDYVFANDRPAAP